jgi:hypothetical protein
MLSAAIGAAGALLFWTVLGLSISRRIVSPVLAMPIAPALGWAVHSAATLPIFLLLGFSSAGVALTATAAAAASLAFLFRSRDAPARDALILRPAYIAGALLALIPAATVAPEHVGGSVLVAPPIFDHAKVPIIDVMVRLGLPPANPFFGEFGERGALAYYYLWHFSAAQLAIVSGLTGWEADIALTWFSAFASLSVMMGLAAWFGRRSAAAWTVLFAAAGSLRFPLASVLGAERLHGLLADSTGFAGWLFQSAWVPQHLMSASCTVIALLLIARVAQGPTPLLFVTLVLVIAAAFESSIWVGGLTLLAGAVIAAGVFLLRMKPPERSRFALNMAGAAVLSIALAAPVLIDEIAALPTRSSGFPLEIGFFAVIGDWVPQSLRPFLDLWAYWLVLLPVELPAIYVPGIAALALFVASPKLDAQRKRDVAALAALTLAGLTLSWLLVSTVGENNDLGLRAVLPAVMILIISSAAGMSLWLQQHRRLLPGIAAIGLLLGLVEAARLGYGNIVERPLQPGRAFAQTPALWQAVRRHAGPDERVGDNPLFLAAMTPWPVNLSWALLSDRSSCFAGRELALAFAPLSPSRREEINALFIRVFDGTGNEKDVRELALRFGCRAVVLTSDDPAWLHDPFGTSGLYRLVESAPDRWRIYRFRSPNL